MRTIKSLLLAAALLPLLGAANPDPTAEVESLRKENAELHRQLADAQAEIARLKVRQRHFTYPTLPVPQLPNLAPRSYPSYPSLPLPPGARERGEGNVRHYLIPVER